MSDALHGVPVPALNRMIEQNAIDSIRDWKRWPEMTVHESPEMVRMECKVRFPIFNLVLKARIPSDRIDPAVRSVMDRVRSLNVPMIWWIGPSTEPEGLGRHLEEKGFNALGRAVGMAVSLDKLDASGRPEGGIDVRPVRNHEDLRMACDIVSNVNDFPDFAAEKWYELHAALGLGPDGPWRYYLAWLGGKPVGTATLYLGKEVASIISVATLPESRGRGVGTAVSVRPFLDARKSGYRIGTLCSSEMGKEMYRRVGFAEYCSIGMYLLM